MFLFSKHKTENKPEAIKEPRELKKDVPIHDYLSKISGELGNYKALYICMHKLKSSNQRSLPRQNLFDTFSEITTKFGGEIFGLPNDDVIVFYNKKAEEEILAGLIKVRYSFHEDPLFKTDQDLEQIGFIKYFDLSTNQKGLRAAIADAMESASLLFPAGKEKTNITDTGSGGSAHFGARKLRRELTPDSLSKVQKALLMTDFSSLIRRQSVCAVIGKSSPQVLFDEVYVSIADLRDMLLPDVDLASNPWLFLELASTLDKRVLAHVAQHDDGALANNFNLNLNISTILSDEFLEFDESINATSRSSIVLDVQLADIFSDIKAYMLAKTFAQYRGYKICIDGISADKLKYLNRENFGADLIKIIWSPSFLEVISNDKHFMDYTNRAERAKMILCRVDDPKAVEIGNSLGINLYEGRYIQKLLSSNPKKTIFSIR